MEPLEDHEDLVGVLLSMPMPLSLQDISHMSPAPRTPMWTLGSRTVELHSVAHQVLEQLHEQGALTVDRRQLVAGDDAPVSSMIAEAGAVPGRALLPGPRGRSRGQRPTREKANRSLMSCCMRLAPSTAYSMYWSPRSSSWPL
jgi:hypothetical protein